MSNVKDLGIKFVAIPAVVLCMCGASPTAASYVGAVTVGVGQVLGIGAATAPKIGPAIKQGQDYAKGTGTQAGQG